MNKAWDKLNPIDRILRVAKPVGMESGTKVTIELICGFELFNTRPYHNYETWSDGYRVSDGHVTAEAEDLDDAVQLFVKRLEEASPKPKEKV